MRLHDNDCEPLTLLQQMQWMLPAAATRKLLVMPAAATGKLLVWPAVAIRKLVMQAFQEFRRQVRGILAAGFYRIAASMDLLPKCTP